MGREEVVGRLAQVAENARFRDDGVEVCVAWGVRLGFRASGLRFRDYGLGFRFRASGFGFRASGFGFRASGLRFRV